MSNKQKIILGLTLVIAVVWGGVYINKTPQKQHIVTIGVIMPFSGDLGIFGENIKKGVEIAKKNFPANKFKIIYEDTHGLDNSAAITAYHKLADVDNIDLLIGPFGPEQMLAIAPLTEAKRTPVFGVSLCEDRLKQYSTLFCTYPSFKEQVESAMPEIKKLGLKRLMLVTENEELGNIVSREIQGSAPIGGYEFIGEERGKRGDTDFRSMITKIKMQNPDVVYSVLAPTDGHIFLRQLNELRFTGISFTQLDTTEEKLRSFGTAMEGVYLPGHIDEHFEENFMKAYAADNKDKPDMYVALGHSTTELVLSTLEKNNWDLSKLQDKVVERADSKTAIKDFQFKKDHTVSIPLQTLIFKNGKIQTL